MTTYQSDLDDYARAYAKSFREDRILLVGEFARLHQRRYNTARRSITQRVRELGLTVRRMG